VGWASRSSPGTERESAMHMLDWNTYRQQLVAGVGGLGKLNPDIVKGYAALSRAGQKAGHLLFALLTRANMQILLCRHESNSDWRERRPASASRLWKQSLFLN
jgi:hypothetical protein